MISATPDTSVRHIKIDVTHRPRRRWPWQKRFPRVMAVFAYRFDVHLVPALIENITPMVDGWIALDNRGDEQLVSAENRWRHALLEAAHNAGAQWILAVDPDERYEPALAQRMSELTSAASPIVWGFNLREMYSPTEYRVDGIWGSKVQWRLFPIFDELFPTATSRRFSDMSYHSPWHPLDYRKVRCDLNLYHLKMITAERRRARRDLYNHLDPHRQLQDIGYDYLAEDAGAVLERIPDERMYRPAHTEDGGLWMPSLMAGNG